MHVLRRATIRASAYSTAPFTSGSRFIRTAAFNAPRTQSQIQLSPFQRRFASNEPGQSGDEVLRTEPADTASSEASGSASSSLFDAIKDKAEDVKDAVGSMAGRARAARGPGEPSNVLYVGNLYFGVKQDAVRDEFERFGEVDDVKLISDPRGLSKGFGYVTFKTQADATKAREALSGEVFEGRRMHVDWAATPSSPRTSRAPLNPPSNTLFIGNMSYEMSDSDLHTLFKDVKNCTDVRVAVDRVSGQPRGFAHADFTDVASAEKAKEYLSSKEFFGRLLRIDFGKSARPPRRVQQ